MPDDRLLDAAEVAAMLNQSERWVRDKTREGLIPHVRLPGGRFKMYRRESILAWFEELECVGRAPISRRRR